MASKGFSRTLARDLNEQDVENLENAYDHLRSDLEGLDDVRLAEADAAVGESSDAQIEELARDVVEPDARRRYRRSNDARQDIGHLLSYPLGVGSIFRPLPLR